MILNTAGIIMRALYQTYSVLFILIIIIIIPGSNEVSKDEANDFIAKAQANYWAAFEEWTTACSKNYSDTDQQQAFALFQRSVDAAAAINADPTATYFASVNCLADRVSAPTTSSGGNGTAVEEPRVPTGFRPPPDPLYTSSARAAALAAGTASCPEQLDWRKLGAVTGVKDQGVSCSSSWAFAATGAVEAAHYIANGKLLDLSEGQLVDCLYKGVPKDKCEVHVVGENESCETIINSCSLTQNVLILLNQGIDCGTQLGVGRDVCVGPKGMPGSGCHGIKVATVMAAAEVDRSTSVGSGSPRTQLHELQPSSGEFNNASTSYQCITNYTVTLGDTCSKVLSQTGLSEPELYVLNPSIDCNVLEIGSVLCLEVELRTEVASYADGGPVPPPYKEVQPCRAKKACPSLRFCRRPINVYMCRQKLGGMVSKIGIYNTESVFGGGDYCPRGNMNDAFKYIMQAGGIASTSTYGGYPGKQTTCRVNSNKAATQLVGYTTVPSMDEAALMQLLCNQPVAVALTASEAFKLYSGGVFNPPDSACSSKREAVNHAVLLVGYGTDEATGQDYWLAKNSWGEAWGEGGYIRIKRGANTCGITTHPPTFPTILGARPKARTVKTVPADPVLKTDPSCPPTYTMSNQDTLFSIAQRYCIKLKALMMANPKITSPYARRPGQSITLPCPPIRNCAKKVTLRKGDSLWTIARKFSQQLQDMLEANPDVTVPDMITPGDVVFVPPCTDAPAEVQMAQLSKDSCTSLIYTAVVGDYFGGVAAAHNMNVGDLIALNPGLQDNPVLVEGQQLHVKLCPKALRPPWVSGTACREWKTANRGDNVAAVLRRATFPRPAEVDVRVANNIDVQDMAYRFPAPRSVCIPFAALT